MNYLVKISVGLLEISVHVWKEYDRDLSLPLGLALGSPIFPSGCEGKLGVALESLQGPNGLEVFPTFFNLSLNLAIRSS